MRKKIIFFGDSIIKYNKNKLLVDWSDFLKKKIILNFPNKYTFYSKTIVGLNSTQGIKTFKNLYNRPLTAFLILYRGSDCLFSFSYFLLYFLNL